MTPTQHHLITAFFLLYFTVRLVLWLREPIPRERRRGLWRGFMAESRSYMEGTPRWRFYGRLPLAWVRYAWLSRGDA